MLLVIFLKYLNTHFYTLISLLIKSRFAILIYIYIYVEKGWGGGWNMKSKSTSKGKE